MSGSSRSTRASGRLRTPLRRGAALALASLAIAFAATAFADARTDYLVRALRTSTMFRVRAQAAISLGNVESEPAVIQALSRALRDSHPAVRASAAAALERHGDPSALPALRRIRDDRQAAVRNAARRAITRLEALARTQPRTRPVGGSGGGSSNSGGGGPARYYVAVGTPGTKVRGISRGTLQHAREVIQNTARAAGGVQIAPNNERPAAATRVLRQNSALTGYYLDVSITSLGPRNGGLRAAVSIILQSYPDRNIRSMLNGAATVTGGSGESAQRQAIEGALRGALRNLPQAMAASARSSQASAASRSGRRRR